MQSQSEDSYTKLNCYSANPLSHVSHEQTRKNHQHLGASLSTQHTMDRAKTVFGVVMHRIVYEDQPEYLPDNFDFIYILRQ